MDIRGHMGRMSKPRDYYMLRTRILGHATLPHYEIVVRVEQVYQDLDYLESGILRYQSTVEHSPIPDWLLEGELTKSKEEAIYRCGELFLGEYTMELEQLNENIDLLKETLRRKTVWAGGGAAMNSFRSILGRLDEPPDVQNCPHPRTLDPFTGYRDFYGYSTQLTGDDLQFLSPFCYILRSVGPDGDEDVDITCWEQGWPHFGQEKEVSAYRYDPTNGIVSDGDIFFFWPDERTPKWK